MILLLIFLSAIFDLVFISLLLLVWRLMVFDDFDWWLFLRVLLIFILLWALFNGFVSEVFNRVNFVFAFLIGLSSWKIEFFSIFQLCSKLLPFTTFSNSFTLITFVTHLLNNLLINELCFRIWSFYWENLCYRLTNSYFFDFIINFNWYYKL